MVERIEWEGSVLALVMRGKDTVEGVNFVTPLESPLQLGVLQHRAGARIKPHIHRDHVRTIEKLQEVLHIDSGKVEVEFFDNKGNKVAGTILETGDTILLISGGHGFNILENAKIIEVKQGPYFGTSEDKVRFPEGDER